MTDEELRALLGNEQQLTEDPFGGQPQTTEQVPKRPAEPAAPSAFSFAPAAAGAEPLAAKLCSNWIPANRLCLPNVTFNSSVITVVLV